MHGKLSLSFLKLMAVVSALAIGGGYVAWRQSEAEKANERERGEQTKAEQELELIVGSKNPVRKMLTDEEMDDYLQKGKDFIETIPGIPEGSKEVSNIIPLLPGSKSISMPLFTMEEVDRATIDDQIKARDRRTAADFILPPVELEAEPPEEKELKLLPGSKSSIVIPVEPEPEKSE